MFEIEMIESIFNEIMDVPKEKKKGHPSINVISKLSDLTLGRAIFPKYLEPQSPIVDVHIDGLIVPNTLIDLVAAMNVIIEETMLNLNLQGAFRKTTTVLQLANISIVLAEGVVEELMASIDSWEYLVDFLVLQTKTNFNHYPLILGIPWLTIVDAYISCRVGNMTINNGHLSKQLVLYPPAHPHI